AHAGLAGRTRITFRCKTSALLVARENRANLRLRKRLMDFHARAARISKHDLDAFAFEGFHEDVAPEHRRADLGAFRCGFFFSSYFAHTIFRFAADNRGLKQKPATVSSRGFLLK